MNIRPRKKLKDLCGFNKRKSKVSSKLRKQVPPPVKDRKNDISLSRKRGPQIELNQQVTKRHRVGCSMTLHCTKLLERLMNHPACESFNQPIDPVALKIPNYFDIITKPMDLGTVKRKLQKNLYSEPEMFAADVRLTFANAMRYNPPSNNVHILAKLLRQKFENEWKPVEGKRFHGNSGVGMEKNSQAWKFENCNTKEHLPKKPSSLALKSSRLSDESTKTSNARVEKVEHPKNSRENYHKVTDVGGKYCSALANNKHKFEPVASKSSAHGSSSCQCSRPLESKYTSSSDEIIINEVQLSPSKALHVERLKIRFAATILKAKREMNLNNGDNDALEQEEQKFKRLQREEMRATEIELNKRRQEEKAALEKLEKSILFEDNVKTMKELEELSGWSLYYQNPLEKLGLFLKTFYDHEDM